MLRLYIDHIMKAKVLYLLIWIAGIVQCFGQTASKTPPVIDMHLHVYSDQTYWGGTDYVLKDTILSSPRSNSAQNPVTQSN